MNQPPRIARWVLNHFGCSPNNDAVIGDLDERYQQGRSSSWYWRQALVTLIVGFCHELRTHKGVAIKAVIRGWWLMYLSSAGLAAFSWIGDYMAAINSVAGTKLQETAPLIFQMSAEGLVRCLLTAWIMWSYALAGFFVARSSRKDRVFAVLCFAATVPILVFVGRPSTFPIEVLTAVGAQLLILFGGGILTQTATLRHRLQNENARKSGRII